MYVPLIRMFYLDGQNQMTKYLCAGLYAVVFFQLQYVFVVADPGLSNPVYKDYHRTYIQERDRDMLMDQSSNEEDSSLFGCFSRLIHNDLLNQAY